MLSKPVYPGIVQNDLSDHDFIYCAIPFLSVVKPEKYTTSYVRDVKNLDFDKFLGDLEKELPIFNQNIPFIDSHTFNFVFSKFLQLVKSRIDFNAPLKNFLESSVVYMLSLGCLKVYLFQLNTNNSSIIRTLKRKCAE